MRSCIPTSGVRCAAEFASVSAVVPRNGRYLAAELRFNYWQRLRDPDTSVFLHPPARFVVELPSVTEADYLLGVGLCFRRLELAIPIEAASAQLLSRRPMSY